METTITIEDDVFAKLSAEVERRDATLKEIVNETLRLGLQAKQAERQPDSAVQKSLSTPQIEQADEHFKVHARAMGGMPNLNYDKISELIEHIEGEQHR